MYAHSYFNYFLCCCSQGVTQYPFRIGFVSIEEDKLITNNNVRSRVNLLLFSIYRTRKKHDKARVVAFNASWGQPTRYGKIYTDKKHRRSIY